MSDSPERGKKEKFCLEGYPRIVTGKVTLEEWQFLGENSSSLSPIRGVIDIKRKLFVIGLGSHQHGLKLIKRNSGSPYVFGVCFSLETVDEDKNADIQFGNYLRIEYKSSINDKDPPYNRSIITDQELKEELYDIFEKHLPKNLTLLEIEE